MVVITSHNSRTYQINRLDTELTPASFNFFDRSKNKTISMSEYFSKKYNIELEPEQPLLVVNQIKRDDIYLPLQVCFEIVKPKVVDSETLEILRYNPKKRLDNIQKFVNTLT